MKASLCISELHVAVDKKTILHGIDLVIEPCCIHALMGPNGSGKSTLAYALAGHPRYTITKGSIKFNDEDITKSSPDKRARKGLFVAFQQVPIISGLTVFSFLKEAYQAHTGILIDSKSFQDFLLSKIDILAMDKRFLNRSLYDGFSGGEKKRLELLQLLLFNPKVAILDEIDSGVDVDSLVSIINSIQEVRRNNPAMSIIIITHYQHILRSIKPDYVHVLLQGTIAQSGDILLAQHIEKRGYQVI
jgi:Fe-S cluster assembly ATP-binding protein